MFFHRNKHIMIDLGTGNNNKINWALTNKQVCVCPPLESYLQFPPPSMIRIL